MSETISWFDVISATHGVSINDGQAEAWESILKLAIPDVKNKELCNVLYQAMERDEKLAGYRMTVKDLIRWVNDSRRGWAERTIVKDGKVYFPDRPHICGQIPFRKATEGDQVEVSNGSN